MKLIIPKPLKDAVSVKLGNQVKAQHEDNGYSLIKCYTAFLLQAKAKYIHPCMQRGAGFLA